MTIVASLSVALLLVAAGCTQPEGGAPGDGGGDGLYIAQQPDIFPVPTPKASPIVWGAAPPIDPNYGGIIYAGTGLETNDPRPALDTNGNQPLRMWVADPADGRSNRPAIIWLHGGGFAAGLNSMHGLAANSGVDYARRGYVGFSVEYRINTTLIGSGERPPSLCQWVQHADPTDPLWPTRYDTCRDNITAATRDALAAVRYVRTHAAEFGVDPDRIAVGGFSAGAVTAVGVAYRADDPGPLAYFPGDNPTAQASRVQAVFGASGCLFPNTPAGGLPEIVPSSTPISLIASRFDQAVFYSCTAATVQAARSQTPPLVAELTSYCLSNLHGQNLYDANRAVTDMQWTTFLARALDLRHDVRPPSADEICPN